MANVDKIIEDLIKGASRAGAQVELHDGKGREEKLAGAIGGGVGSLFGPLGATIGGGASADDGRGLQGAGGGLLGNVLGGMGGAGLGALLGQAAGLDPATMAALLGASGSIAGGAYGAHLGGTKQSNDLSALMGGMDQAPQSPAMGGSQIPPEVLMLLEQILGGQMGHGGGMPMGLDASGGGMPPAHGGDAGGSPFPPKKKDDEDDKGEKKAPPKKDADKDDAKGEKKAPPKKDDGDDDDCKEAALKVAYVRGVTAAQKRFKVGFLGPLIGMAAQLGGPMLAEKGLGAAAGRLGGSMLGRAAGAGAKLLGGSGFGSQMAQLGTGALMGHAANRLAG